MLEWLDIETFRELYVEVIAALSLMCFGMILYRYSILYKLRESKVISEAAYTDALTGKGNRYKFNKVMENLVTNEANRFAVCFMDLDGFKHINDNMGHDAGDELLIKLSEVLKVAMPPNGEVFRLGGDEFAIIINNIKDREEVETVVKSVNAAVKKPLNIRGSKITLEYSLGIAIYPEDSKNKDELVSFADSAMYHIKETGKNGYYFHNASLKSRLENKAKMENDLKKAFENDEFGIDFQPRVNVKDNNEMWFEALLYWNHGALGKLRAQYFLDYIESIGLVINIDELVLDKSIDILNELKAKGYINVKIALNMSLRHFMRSDFVDKFCSILEKRTFDKGSLMLEITDNIEESKIEDYKLKMDRIKEYGVKISVNNLEIKYEILNLFNKLPIDEMKVSAEYVDKSSAFNKSVLKDIVELGKDLYYDVTVVKIEDDKQLQKALSCSVDKVQGNYLYKALSVEELIEFLDKYKNNESEIIKIAAE